MLGIIIFYGLVAIAQGLDLRVAKGLHSRGYDAVRISVVDDGSTSYGSFFDYNANFQQVWSDMHLHSTVKELQNGSATFNIAGNEIEIKLPAEGSATRGFLIADPCISSRDLNCPFLDSFQTFDRLTEVINTVVGSDDIDFWGIIGDNFYEHKSSIGKMLFDRLTLEVKSKVFLSVPGNHDFWIVGGPPGVPQDQFGYGFMQYYGQDTLAGLKTAAPFDFSVPRVPHQLPKMENFVFSNQIGNLAVFGFSGAHAWADLQPHTEDFCTWMQSTETVDTVMVLGHWNEGNLGCSADTTAPKVWSAMKDLPGCNSKLMLYVDGHEHCNHVTEPGHGFMIGANGMGGCGQFGFMVLETSTRNTIDTRVDYFEISNAFTDYWDPLSTCLKEGGYLGCRDSHSASWLGPPTTTTTTTTRTRTHSNPGGDGLQGWEIVVIVVAGLALTAVVAGLVISCTNRPRQVRVIDANAATPLAADAQAQQPAQGSSQ